MRWRRLRCFDIPLFPFFSTSLASLGCFFVFVFVRGFILRAKVILRGQVHNRLERFIWIVLFYLYYFFLFLGIWSGLVLDWYSRAMGFILGSGYFSHDV
jgi:hypothetical protein